MTGQLTFSVLGLLRGWRDDAELALGSPQQHAALSALLLREGRPATVSQLVDAVWGTDQSAQRRPDGADVHLAASTNLPGQRR
jgi:DNA-binding SARP family transcriptional activator